MSRAVALLRGHLMIVLIVVAAVASGGGVFVFARPEYRPPAPPSPPTTPIPYAKVTYSTADAQRAFRTVGIKLVRHTQEPIPAAAAPIIDLSNSGDLVVVDVFGDPRRVAASGFSDYFTFDAKGHFVKAPQSCTPGANNAERWHKNIRVIVSCARAGASSSAWLARVERAFAQLS